LLKKTIKLDGIAEQVNQFLVKRGINTVCQAARCPNKYECYAKGTATFLILGNNCTRNCSFCAVDNATPQPPDPEESEKIASTAKEMGLGYLVITSVTRDDLPDGGAAHFAKVITHTQEAGIKTEVLIPDFQGSEESLKLVTDSRPVVIAHNLETVPRLYPEIRSSADYPRSLKLLSDVKKSSPGLLTKSGLMLGLGENEEEILATLADLRKAQCDILTLGQYLQPRNDCHKVVREIPPEEFARYQEIGMTMGFKAVASAAFVRSSYRAADVYESAR
jgi:lipoic acid synthetase